MNNAITKGIILNASSNPDVYARGEKYYRDGKLLNIRAEQQNGHTVIKASVEGNYKNYEVNIKINSQGALDNYSCSCESHNIWRGACKHVVAALFSVMEGRGTVAQPSIVKQAAKGLTDSLERLIFADIDAGLAGSRPVPLNPVLLEPCLHYDKRGEVYLTFTVGRGRKYIIKSLPAFLASVKREETVSYGNGLRFCHTPDMFDEQSRALLNFLIREDGIYNETAMKLNRQYQYMYNAKNNARILLLSERSIDDFFNIYAGREIDGEIDGETRLVLRDGLPNVVMRVTASANAASLAAESFNIRAKHGMKYHYLITKDAVYRSGKNDALILVNLLRALSDSAHATITFAGYEARRFIANILPRLMSMGLVTSVEGDVPVAQYSTMQAKLYFDYEKRDLLCRAEFIYGDSVFDPLDDSGETPDDSDVQRNAAGEYAVKRRLAVMGFNADAARKLYILSDGDMIYTFLNEPSGLDSLRECAEVYVSDALDKKTLKIGPPSVGVRLQGNLLDVTFEGAGYQLSDLLEALESYRAKKRFHRLRDGRFMPLDGESVASVAELLEALDISRKDIQGNTLKLPAYRALYVDGLIKDKDGAPPIKKDADYLALIERFGQVKAEFDIPETLQNVLREYQKKGYQWLKTLSYYNFGGILADDMGLGKTIQVISVLLRDKRPGAQSLVVSPTSLLYNWENEIKRFAPSLTTTVISGLADKRRELIAGATGDVLITTYDMMKRDIAHYEGMEFDYIIADEAQNIKNPSTQNAKAIKILKGRVRYALTGTPIENALTELWSIFDFIMPGYLHSAARFSRLYEFPIVRDNDPGRAARLRQQIAPFVLRRLKKNVLTELPDKTETTLLAELKDEQRKIYLAHLMQAKGELDAYAGSEGFSDNRIRILAQLTRLRQLCCHPSLFVENYTGGSGKLELTLETIQIAVEAGHRVLLFSQFTSMLDLLREALDESPFAYFYLDGATKAQDRMNMTGRFNSGERDLFLISLKAGGTGLNLTGADVVIHYDPWWNPSVMDQASDRAHRYGQEKAVQIFNVVAKDTIEEKIMELQEKKRGLIDAVITDGGSFINALTEEEVRALFAS